MADKRISELTALTGANVADTDLLPIVDTSATETKKITFGEFKTALDTATGFVRITGDTMTGNLSFGNNNKAIFGTGSSLEIYGTGTHSFIKELGTGNLYIDATSLSVRSATGEPYIVGTADAGVSIYYNNALKIATTATGIDVTGTVVADGLDIGVFGSTGRAANLHGENLLMDGAGPFDLLIGDGAIAYMSISTTDNATAMKIRNYTGNSDIAVFERTTGNVGIGTSSPVTLKSATTLQVSGNAKLGDDNGRGLLSLGDIASTGANVGIWRGAAGAYAGTGNYLNLGGYDGITFTTGAADISAQTERMRIDSSGNVGIGTALPASTLHLQAAANADTTLTVTGGVAAGLGSNAIIKLIPDGTAGAGIINIDGSDGSDVFQIKQSNATRLTIGSTGTVTVGKTAEDIGTAGHAFAAQGYAFHTRSGNTPLFINRLTSDGTLAEFRKDGTTVGTIGVATEAAGTGIYIGKGDTCLAFQTRSDNSISPFSADTGATRDDAIDLGNAAARFDDIFATNGTIQTSDANEKQDIEALSEAETRVAVAAKGLLKKFRWKARVAEKGDDARIHFGIIAQDLQDSFAAEGLDAGRYAMFISSTWWETQTDVPAVEAVAEVLDEEGNVVTEAVEAKEAYTRTDTYQTLEEAPEGATERTRLGVRYSELLAFIIGAL